MDHYETHLDCEIKKAATTNACYPNKRKILTLTQLASV